MYHLAMILTLLISSSCLSSSQKKISKETYTDDELLARELKDIEVFVENNEDFALEVEDKEGETLKIEPLKENQSADYMKMAIEEEVIFQEGHGPIISPTPNANTGDLIEYKTHKGDTLMLIAFHIYGDYSKWREIYSLNKDVIKENFDLAHRPTLKYKKPKTPFFPPNGRPYFIKTGDSLSLISQKVYGDWSHWPAIYKNNPQQVRDPDLIFAGFTLYYPSSLKVATNKLY